MPFNKFGGGFGGFGGGMNFGGYGGQGFGNGAANQGAAAVNPFLARRSFNFPPQVRRDLAQPNGQQGPGGMYRNLFHRINRPGVMPQTGVDNGAAPVDGIGNAATQGMRPQQAPRPQFGGYASIPPESGMAPQQAMGRSSFANTPARQLTPQEAATMQRMDDGQSMNRLQDANPNYRYASAVADINRQADSIQRTLPPDVNDPNFQPITPQQAFLQIPNNPYAIMRDRFNAMKANRSPNVQDQSAMDGMTASQATSTMPNYRQRLTQANPALMENLGNAMGDARITPMPRAGGMLSPQEVAQMQAVGSSAGEWRAKSDWMRAKGYQGEMTPQQSQEYTAEQQQKRLTQNDMIHQQKMARIGQADQIREAKARQSGQLFRRFNPELFQTPDLTAAQLYSSLAGGSLQNFQQTGLTPQQMNDSQLQARQQAIQEAQMWAQAGNDEMAQQALQRAGTIGTGLNGTVFDGGQTPQEIAGRTQGLRGEDGQIDQSAFGDTLGAVMGSGTPTAEGLISAGITEQALQDYIDQSGGYIWNSPAQQRRIDEAKRALEVLRSGRQGPSQTQAAQPPLSQSPVSPFGGFFNRTWGGR